MAMEGSIATRGYERLPPWGVQCVQERLSKGWMCNLILTTFDVVLTAEALGGTLDGFELHSHGRIPVAMGWGRGS